MRGAAGVAMLIDIIQLHFFVAQALLSNKMALIGRLVILSLIGLGGFSGRYSDFVECCHTSKALFSAVPGATIPIALLFG
jgi:hypothetical protein